MAATQVHSLLAALYAIKMEVMKRQHATEQRHARQDTDRHDLAMTPARFESTKSAPCNNITVLYSGGYL